MQQIAQAPPGTGSGNALKQPVKRAANERASADVRRIAGRVVDGDGKPIKAARLWWVLLENSANDRGLTVEGASNAEGRFELEAPSAWKHQWPWGIEVELLWILAPERN